MKLLSRLIKLFGATVILPAFAFAQLSSLKIVEEVPFHLFSINGFKIDLSSDKISIYKEARQFFSEEIKGKKNFKVSGNKKYFFISNYAFPSGKFDYKIEIKVFNDSAKLIYEYKVIAPFDLPHPIFSINDEGKIASFNPLNFKLTLIDGFEEKAVTLEKEIEFEMERSSFVGMTNSDVYVLTSLKPLSIEEDEGNAFLYKINLYDLSIEKKIIDYSIPLSLSLIDKNIIVSGVKFQNMIPNGSTLEYNPELNVIVSSKLATEKIMFLNGSYYSKYEKKIYKLNNNLTQAAFYELKDVIRIIDIIPYKNNLAALVEESNSVSLYLFNSALSLDIKKELNDVNLNEIESIREMEDKLWIYAKDRTIIFD